MKKVFAISAFVLGSVMAVAQPLSAAPRDRDDHRSNRNKQHYGNNFRDDGNNFRDDRRDNHGRDYDRRYPQLRRAPDYRFQNRVFGDRRYGYYDRRGEWCWY
jgi:hypothetical protein